MEVEGQLLPIVSEFLSDRRHHLRLDGKVNASVDVVSEVPQGCVLILLLFILYICELFHIVGNHIVSYADDTTIYALIPRPLSCPQEIGSLNQDLAAINSWCLKWHMRLNPKNIKSMMVSRSRTSAPGYGDLNFFGAELE